MPIGKEGLRCLLVSRWAEVPKLRHSHANPQDGGKSGIEDAESARQGLTGKASRGQRIVGIGISNC
jgi:hypothetical protein